MGTAAPIRKRAKRIERSVSMFQAEQTRRIRVEAEHLLQHGAVKVMMRDRVPLDPPEIVEPELGITYGNYIHEYSYRFF